MENDQIIEKTKQLFLEYKNGNIDAINDILLLNDQLVVSIARKIHNKFSEFCEFDDLVQEGRLGLYEASLRFDIDKGYNFSTYATYWIRKNIQMYVFSNLKIGTISNYYILKALKIKKFIENYTLVNKNYPTNEIISQELNISIEKIEELKLLLKGEKSLDYIVKSDTGEEIDSLLDIIQSEIDVEEQVMNNCLHNTLIDIINNLNEKDKFILLNRYGLLTGKTMTQEEIGKIYGSTRQAIYQLEKQALQKIKYKCFKYRLNEFID